MSYDLNIKLRNEPGNSFTSPILVYQDYHTITLDMLSLVWVSVLPYRDTHNDTNVLIPINNDVDNNLLCITL